MYGVLLTPEFSDQQILVDANIITNVGSGIGVGGEEAITVSNNAIDGCQHFGIWVYGTHPDHVTQQIRIENNVIRRVAGYGIVAESRNQGHLTDVVIQSNRLYECEGGIQVNGLQGSNIVDDNIVTSSSVRKKLLGFYMLRLDASDTKFSRNASMNYLTSEVPSNILGPNNALK
jgi:Right handed beta helix region